MKPGNSLISGLGTTIFEVMSRLAIENQAINLGQGFPDDRGPEAVLAAAAEAVTGQSNQYPPMMGLPELRQAVAAHGRRFYGLDVDWQREVLVTSGATEALAACLFGLIEPGDEVVLFEPLYDSYLPILRRAGGVPRLVRLDPPDWRIPEAALRAAFSDRTKLILFNTPLNPAAKVFDEAELSLIAELCLKHDAIALADEVYEHIVFDGRRHRTIMNLPGMRERSIKLGSAGKTFSLTGWKVGYVTAPAHLLQPITKTHQYLVFTTPPNLQRAVAFGLAQDDAYFAGLAAEMQRRRDRFADGLRRIGFGVLDCQGTYFVGADFTPLGFAGDDTAFCRHITTEAKVAAIPMSAFYASQDGRGTSVARFCFAKQDAVLDAAIDRLAAHFGRR
ncbi:MAG: aminotransferase [Thalassobaculales bacterium]